MFEQFHLANSQWLVAMLFVPILWALHIFCRHLLKYSSSLEKIADKHILPHIVLSKPLANAKRRSLILWSIIYALCIIALSGPRWGYTEIDTYSSGSSMVVLVDLSRSMEASDVKPSRIVRAVQEIRDIIKSAKGIKIGLVAFAARAHIVSPITDDLATVEYLLDSLSTDLITVQGSTIGTALTVAGSLLEAENANNKTILLVTDGGFEEDIAEISDNFAKNVAVNILAIGTENGAPVPGKDGRYLRDSGDTVISKLDTTILKEIASLTGGIYVESSYLADDTNTIISGLRVEASTDSDKLKRVWHERFYVFVLVAMLLLLPFFRKNAAFFVLVVLILPQNSQALSLREQFTNAPQKALKAYNNGDYEYAKENFHDPYNRAVANYKAGEFELAEDLFRKHLASGGGVDTKYNLANSLAKQGKIKEAITGYNEVLQIDPDHANAKYNLELLKKLQQQDKNQQNQQQDDKSGQKQDSNNNEQKDDAGGKDNKGNEDNSDQDSKNNKDKNDQQDDSSGSQPKSKRDIDANQWLDRIDSNPADLLEKQFWVNEKSNDSGQGGRKPW